MDASFGKRVQSLGSWSSVWHRLKHVQRNSGVLPISISSGNVEVDLDIHEEKDNEDQNNASGGSGFAYG